MQALDTTLAWQVLYPQPSVSDCLKLVRIDRPNHEYVRKQRPP